MRGFTKMVQSSIKSLPSRYEPLVGLFGEQAKTTFVKQEEDIKVIARLINQAHSAFQGKLQFIYSTTESGAGKTTFIQSLELFLPDFVDSVIRVINDGGDALDRILTTIRSTQVTGHWFSLIVGLKTLPDKGLTENTKLKEFFPS
jgi:hypothetical protein